MELWAGSRRSGGPSDLRLDAEGMECGDRVLSGMGD